MYIIETMNCEFFFFFSDPRSRSRITEIETDRKEKVCIVSLVYVYGKKKVGKTKRILGAWVGIQIKCFVLSSMISS